MLLNQRADAQGVLRIPVGQLGPGSLVHVVAVDGQFEAYRTLVRPAVPRKTRDRRLANGLDPALHLAQKESLSLYQKGQRVVVEDPANAELKLFPSLRSAFDLYRTLCEDPELAKFSLLMQWPELDAQAKRLKYSELACHELNFFLHEKDPGFFDSVVKPYLLNKVPRTFMDEWLLGGELKPYLEPWRFSRLNTLERILLSRRLGAQSGSEVRRLRDWLELHPATPSQRRRWFDSAILSAALEQPDAVSGLLSGLKAEARKNASAPPMEVADELRALGYAGDEDDLNGLALEEESAEGSSGFFLGRGADDNYDADYEQRAQARSLFRGPGSTRPYLERNYWQRTRIQSGADLIQPNEFWLDYAMATEGEAFLSTHLPQASGNLAEVLMALAVLDLPFEAEEPAASTQGDRLEINPANALLLASREIKPARPAVDALPLLLSQDFFRADDRYRYAGGLRTDKAVAGEFVTGVAYGGKLVLSNPTSAPRRLELLYQIPVGALSLQRGSETRGQELDLGPYATQSLEYFFYFPEAGDFAGYPLHVSREGATLASSSARSFHVVGTATELDENSWAYVSQAGTTEQVLAFLGEANLGRIALDKIAWRMADKDAFLRTTALLRGRQFFAPELWSFGIEHRDLQTSREYLGKRRDLRRGSGAFLDSPLLSLDVIASGELAPMEFAPLINPRAHRFLEQRQILDEGFKAYYSSLLSALAYRPKLDDSDWMLMTSAMLLQDRIAEAANCFAHVDRARLASHVQYDYMSAYMQFFGSEPARARKLAETYRDYPVERWRLLFGEVLAQLDEAEGKRSGLLDPDDLGQRQTQLAEQGPVLELRVEGGEVILEHQNLDHVELNFYAMDIEFLFSTSPFVQQGSNSFSYIRPNRQEQLVLERTKQSTSMALPEEFRLANVLVEVRGQGLVRRQTHFANSLALRTSRTTDSSRSRTRTRSNPSPRSM